MTQKRKLRVFICHASQDKPIVRELYQRLLAVTWIDPWLDEVKLLPGQDWGLEIEKAVESADAVIACISSNSTSKEGYIQKELRFVLDIALEKAEGTIFIIPLRLEKIMPPRRLRSLHYIDYFPPMERNFAFNRLVRALDARLSQKLSFKEHGSDILFSALLSFEEAAFGVEKRIEFDRSEICAICHGYGRLDYDLCQICGGSGRYMRRIQKTVVIPAGVYTGTKVRFTGIGNQGFNGGVNGSVYLNVTVSQHPFFVRDPEIRENLIVYYPVEERLARKGANLQIPLLMKGEYVDLTIPANTQTGDTFYLEQLGLQRLRADGRGDLVVVIETYNHRYISAEIEYTLEIIDEHITFSEF